MSSKKTPIEQKILLFSNSARGFYFNEIFKHQNCDHSIPLNCSLKSIQLFKSTSFIRFRCWDDIDLIESYSQWHKKVNFAKKFLREDGNISFTFFNFSLYHVIEDIWHGSGYELLSFTRTYTFALYATFHLRYGPMSSVIRFRLFLTYKEIFLMKMVRWEFCSGITMK